MFKEWKAIFKKPLFIVVMVGISLIPALYNVIFLSSMWDPYGKVSDLPVAVVNKDKAASFNGKELTIGQNMVKSLKKNEALDYHFVSEKTAKAGLKAGDYYMVITLPSDLSQKAASILTSQPEQMTIDYQTSSGHSFIASKMSDSAMERLKSTVAKNITNTYTSSLFESMGTLKEGINQAAGGSTQIAEGATQLQAGSQTITTNLTTLANSSLTFQNGADKLTTGLTTYTDGVKTLSNGLGTLSTGLEQYTDGVSQLSLGLNQLIPGIKQYTGGVSQLNAGLTALDAAAGQYQAGLSQYTTGVGQLSTGLGTVSTGLNQYTTGVNNLSVGAAELNNQSQPLVDGANQLAAGLKKLSDTVNSNSLTEEDKVQLTSLSTSLSNLQSSLANLPDQVGGQSNIAAEIDNMITTAQNIVTSAQADQTTVLTNIQATSAYQKLSADEQAELTTAVNHSPSQVVSQAQAMISTLTSMKTSLATNTMTDLTGLKSLVGTANTDTAKLTAIINASSQIQTVLNTQLVPASSKLANGVTSYTAGVGQITGSANILASKNDQLNQGFGNLVTGAGALAANSASIAAATNQLTTGITTVTDGSATLAGKNDQLNAGIGKVAMGANTLVSKNDQLTSGTNQVAAGANKLDTNSAQLLSGSQQLSDGATKIADGSEKLADGSSTLTDGLGSLVTGAAQLGLGLSSAGDKLGTVTTKDSNADLLANPLTLKKTDKDNVGKNGVAMAPYMLSVALFVAALSTNMIFAKLPSGKTPSSRREWLRSRLEVNGVIAVIAGVLVYGAVHLIGLTANHEIKTLLLLVLTSVTFMALVTALTTWNNKVGAFFSLILLLLQLASSAGTYPLQLTEKIYQWINPILPMSYSVSGLRQTISMGGAISGQITFLTLALLVFVLAGYMAYNPQKALAENE